MVGLPAQRVGAGWIEKALETRGEWQERMARKDGEKERPVGANEVVARVVRENSRHRYFGNGYCFSSDRSWQRKLNISRSSRISPRQANFCIVPITILWDQHPCSERRVRHISGMSACCLLPDGHQLQALGVALYFAIDPFRLSDFPPLRNCPLSQAENILLNKKISNRWGMYM